jgi:hypothetical protein
MAVSTSMIVVEDSGTADVSIVASSPEAHPVSDETIATTTNVALAIDPVLDRPRRSISPVCPTRPER